MDRSQVAAQQAKLAEHRAQMQHTKQSEATTSAAKEIDPAGQTGKDTAPLKDGFHRAHDHAKGDQRTTAQVSPQLREQDKARPTSGMNGPKPPPNAEGIDRSTHQLRLTQTAEQAKARQQAAENAKMKDGKENDHDQSK